MGAGRSEGHTRNVHDGGTGIVSGPTPVRSYLGRIAAPNPPSAEKMKALRSRAWIDQGVVCIHPDEIADDWLRQGLKNLATTMFGRRMKK